MRPKDAIGRNTITNIQSGMIYGYAGLVDGIVERMRREIEGDVKVVGTGGLRGADAGGRPVPAVRQSGPAASRASG